MQEKNVKLHLGAITASVLFLWNPFLAMFDLVPDAIGFALLLWGTSKIADLAPTLSESRPYLRRLCCLSIAKPLLQVLVLVWQGRQTVEDKGLPFLICMTVVGFETYFFIMTFRGLFAGLDFLGMRYDGKAVFVGQKDMASLTYVSAVVRAALCLLPNLGDMFGGDYRSGLSEDAFDLARYSGLFQIANVLLTSILGIVWAVMLYRYFAAIAAERPFVETLEAAWRHDILPNTGLFLRRNVHTACAFFLCGGICLLDFFADGFDFLPDALGVLFLTIGLYILARRVSLLPHTSAVGAGKRLAVLLGSFGILCGGAKCVLSLLFSDLHYQRVVAAGFASAPSAKPLYAWLIVCGAAEALCLAALVCLMLFGLRALVREHIGSETFATERSAEADAAMRAEEYRRLWWVSGVFLTYLASKITYQILFCRLPILWMPHLILGGIALYLLWSRQGTLTEKVDYKYL